MTTVRRDSRWVSGGLMAHNVMAPGSKPYRARSDLRTAAAPVPSLRDYASTALWGVALTGGTQSGDFERLSAVFTSTQGVEARLPTEKRVAAYRAPAREVGRLRCPRAWSPAMVWQHVQDVCNAKPQLRETLVAATTQDIVLAVCALADPYPMLAYLFRNCTFSWIIDLREKCPDPYVVGVAMVTSVRSAGVVAILFDIIGWATDMLVVECVPYGWRRREVAKCWLEAAVRVGNTSVVEALLRRGCRTEKLISLSSQTANPDMVRLAYAHGHRDSDKQHIADALCGVAQRAANAGYMETAKAALSLLPPGTVHDFDSGSVALPSSRVLRTVETVALYADISPGFAFSLVYHALGAGYVEAMRYLMDRYVLSDSAKKGTRYTRDVLFPRDFLMSGTNNNRDPPSTLAVLLEAAKATPDVDVEKVRNGLYVHGVGSRMLTGTIVAIADVGWPWAAECCADGKRVDFVDVTSAHPFVSGPVSDDVYFSHEEEYGPSEAFLYDALQSRVPGQSLASRIIELRHADVVAGLDDRSARGDKDAVQTNRIHDALALCIQLDDQVTAARIARRYTPRAADLVPVIKYWRNVISPAMCDVLVRYVDGTVDEVYATFGAWGDAAVHTRFGVLPASAYLARYANGHYGVAPIAGYEMWCDTARAQYEGNYECTAAIARARMGFSPFC